MLFNYGYNGVEIESPLLDEPDESTNREGVEYALCRRNPRWRTDQHGNSVLLFDLFDAPEPWAEATEEHITDIFDEGGYGNKRDDETPLGPMIGSSASAIRFDEERVDAFDFTLRPPLFSSTPQARLWTLSTMQDRGVPTPTEVYSHPRTAIYGDTRGQINVRAEECDIDGGVLAKWILDIWRSYRREHVDVSRLSRYRAMSDRSRYDS